MTTGPAAPPADAAAALPLPIAGGMASQATLEQLRARRWQERGVRAAVWIWCGLFIGWLAPLPAATVTQVEPRIAVGGSALLVAAGLVLLRFYQGLSTVRLVADTGAGGTMPPGTVAAVPLPAPPSTAPAQVTARPAPSARQAASPVPGATDQAAPPPEQPVQRLLPDRRVRAERVRALVQQASDLVILLDADGRRREVSPSAYRVLGLHPGDLVGASLFQDVHPDDLDRVLQVHLQCIQEPGVSPPFEFRHRDHEGGWRDLEGIASNLLADPVVGSVVLTCRDITTRKAAEASLRVSEARFRALVQHATDLIVVVDAAGLIRYVSPAARPLLSQEPEALVGTPVIASVHPDDREQVQDTLATRRISLPERAARVEFRVGQSEDNYRVLEATITHLIDDPDVAGVVINARDITERKAFEGRLTRQAFTDALTGLANRPFFLDRLAQALAMPPGQTGTVGVLFLDLDRFKIINDSLGHPAGDALLVTVAQRLLACVRPGDTVARLGGDEFALLLPAVTDPAEATEVAARILASFAQPVIVAEHPVTPGVSIGVVLRTPEHHHPEDLLRDADVALYRAKAAGKGCFVVFDPSMNTHALERLELEHDLREAVERQQLRVHYQPEVDLHSSELVGMEALVRWAHPRRGLLSPMQFIPLAEEMGLIIPIGMWVLREACRQVRTWIDQRPPAAPPLTLSVNLSVRQLQHPGIVEQVREVLTATDFPPSCLRLEITESAAMQRTEQSRNTLQALQALGIHLAIDDFGTGYSSLGYLRGFPVDTIKIDKSFVTHLADDAAAIAIVQAITMLARALEMEVTVEGVETHEQLTRLQVLDCVRAQGYYFSRPLPPETLEALMQKPTHRFLHAVDA